MTVIDLLRDALDALERIPAACEIGEHGPTLDELIAAAESGMCIEGCATSQDAQWAWHRVSEAITRLEAKP